MLRRVVDSTSFRSLGYDPQRNILEVEFTNGHVYQYLDVPRDLYDGLCRSSSKGRYFHTRIRDAFAAVRVH